MLATGCPETKEDWIQLRWEAHFYKTQHRKALEREQVLKAKIRELELTIDRQEIQIKDLIAGFQKTINEQNNKIDNLNKRVEELTAQNVWLKQQLFGRQSEQSDSSQKQNEVDKAKGAVLAVTQAKRPRGQQAGSAGHGRKRRENLPTVEIIHDLQEYEKFCPLCKAGYQLFPMTADSEDIHYEVRVIRRVHKRKCYVPTCRCGIVTGIVTAPPVTKLIPNGRKNGLSASMSYSISITSVWKFCPISPNFNTMTNNYAKPWIFLKRHILKNLKAVTFIRYNAKP